MASKPAPSDLPPEMPANPPADSETLPTPPNPNGPVPDPGTEPWIEGP
jgi:hypothetical protein